jgi:hypothetical protein
LIKQASNGSLFVGRQGRMVGTQMAGAISAYPAEE